MPTPNKPKNTLRQELLANRRALPAAWIAEHSATAIEHIACWPIFKESHSVMLFLSMPDEPQMDNLIRIALQQNKRVCVPALGSVYGQMEGAVIQGLDDLVVGKLGLRMPNIAKTSIINPTELDFILVPGVAFDIAGNRLGMGAGYYDRFLLRSSNALTAGIAWHFQLVSSLIAEEHDIPVNYIISEQEIKLCRRGKM